MPPRERLPAPPPDAPPALRRRHVLAAGAGIAAAALGGAARVAAETKSTPPSVPDWTKALGPGVGDKPYGMPSPHEKHVVRRTVDWLTASKESSVSF